MGSRRRQARRGLPGLPRFLGASGTRDPTHGCRRPGAESGGWQGLPPVSTLRGDDAESGRFVLLFPNTAISVLPNHAFIIVANPLGQDRTVEEAVILSHPDSLDNPNADKELDQLMSFWDLVNLQDIE